MNNPGEVIIYLDIFVFKLLITFFALLFKSKSLFIKKIMARFNHKGTEGIESLSKIKKDNLVLVFSETY